MTMHCDIVSAEQEIFSGRVTMVIATGTMGELGIMPGHAPLLTGIKPGPVRLKFDNGEERVFFASGGFLEIQAAPSRYWPTPRCAPTTSMRWRRSRRRSTPNARWRIEPPTSISRWRPRNWPSIGTSACRRRTEETPTLANRRLHSADERGDHGHPFLHMHLYNLADSGMDSQAMSLEIIVLAAGQGTRMRSKLPKVLHDLAGRPLLSHVLRSVRSLDPQRIHVVIGHAGAQVRAAFADARDLTWVEQAQQRTDTRSRKRFRPWPPAHGPAIRNRRAR